MQEDASGLSWCTNPCVTTRHIKRRRQTRTTTSGETGTTTKLHRENDRLTGGANEKISLSRSQRFEQQHKACLRNASTVLEDTPPLQPPTMVHNTGAPRHPHRLYSQVCVNLRVDERVLDQLPHLLKDTRNTAQVVVPAAATRPDPSSRGPFVGTAVLKPHCVVGGLQGST